MAAGLLQLSASQLAARFTESQRAVLRIVGDEVAASLERVQTSWVT
ncbi:hypothetical protein [Methylobacterium flocculans]|nr:hypothetical protein [Methylobacterium sp. FF17]